MSQFIESINAFNGGEISPRMYGRQDIDKWNSAAATIQNFLIQSEGGLFRRSGARFVRQLVDESQKSKLVPFIFSTEQAYILEFSHNTLRFYKDEGAVLNTSTNIAGITAANPVVVTTTAAHGLSNGDFVFVDGGSDVPEVNSRFYKIANVTTLTMELLTEDGTGNTAWSAGGSVASVYELTTTYTQTELEEITYAQSNDVLYISHKDHAPAKLSRTGHTAWTLTDAELNDGPYLATNPTPTDITSSSAGPGAGNLTADAVTGINDDQGFLSSDVGRSIRMVWPSNEFDPNNGWAVIDSITSTTIVAVTIKTAILASNATNRWRLGAFWPDNYPAAVSFGEGRLWWGGTPADPSAIYSSESGAFNGYAPSDKGDGTITDANAIVYYIGSNQVNNVLWMEVGRNLIVGTPGAVFPVQASSNNEPVTPTNINVPVGSPIGAAAIRPVRVNNVLVYVDRTKTTLRGIQYAIEADYDAVDLTRIADHVSVSPLEELAYQLTPDSIIWCRRTDGKIVALTYEPSEDVFAWSRHQVGGSFGTGDAVVESIAVIPTPDGGADQLWMTVKRTINSATRRYVEFIEDDFSDSTAVEDGFFVDSGLTYSGTAATTISGLDHLEGETVQVLADGAVVADKTVSGGSITLTDSATKVHVGLAYESDLETLRLDLQTGGGARAARGTQGIYKRINQATVRLHRTNSGKFGRSATQLDPIQFRDAGDDMDAAVPLFSGDKQLPIELGNDREAKLYFRQDEPLPFNILSMTLLGSTGDR